MKTESVIVLIDIYCKWSNNPPRYRCYVGNELFSERKWIWQDSYLEEMLPINARPGIYDIRCELVDSSGAGIKVRNIRIDHGPGRINSQGQLEITGTSQ